VNPELLYRRGSNFGSLCFSSLGRRLSTKPVFLVLLPEIRGALVCPGSCCLIAPLVSPFFTTSWPPVAPPPGLYDVGPQPSSGPRSLRLNFKALPFYPCSDRPRRFAVLVCYPPKTSISAPLLPKLMPISAPLLHRRLVSKLRPPAMFFLLRSTLFCPCLPRDRVMLNPSHQLDSVPRMLGRIREGLLVDTSELPLLRGRSPALFPLSVIPPTVRLRFFCLPFRRLRCFRTLSWRYVAKSSVAVEYGLFFLLIFLAAFLLLFPPAFVTSMTSPPPLRDAEGI